MPHERRQRLERGRAERDRHALRVDEDVRASRLLELRQPRRMIARDRVDGARRRARPHRVAIAAVRGTQRRPDLGERAELRHLLVAQQQILWTRLRPHALALGLRALDALEPQARREVHDVDRAAGEPPDENRTVDRLLLRPIGARRGKVRRLRAALGDRLVLEIAEDVAVFCVDLAHAVERGDLLHRLAQELVGDHPLAALLVRHEHLERPHAESHRFGEAVEDRGLVLEDEVEAEVDDRFALGLLAQASRGLRQRFARRVVHERHDAGQPRARRRLRGDLPVVVLRADVQMAVDEAREDQLSRGVDDAIGRRQPLVRRQRDDAPTVDRDARLDDIAGRDDPAALHDQINGPRRHRFTWGAPKRPPTPPSARSAAGNPWRSSAIRALIGWAPSR